ncbi:MAG: hypothetical protein WCT17_00940 [Bacilli bacterium]
MKNKNKNAFQNMYNRNPDNQAYIVEISLDNYSELFNGWDASAIKRRDLEPEVLNYLEQVGNEIPLKEKIEICFYLPSHLKDADKELKCITGVKNNFNIVMFFTNKSLKHNYRRIITYVFMSVIFLTAAYLLRNLIHSSLLLSISLEGLFIGGWFLLWESFSLFFFESHEIRKKEKIFKRFLDTDIYFKETKSD